MIEQIGSLVEQVRAFPDPQARDIALQLTQAILDMHADALARLMELLSRYEDNAELVETLVSDPKVGGILLLHDLHPLDLATRVQRALQTPELRSGGGKIELISSQDGIVRVRVDGRPGIRATLEQAIWAAAPDAHEVIVDGGDELAPAGFVPIQQLLAGHP